MPIQIVFMAFTNVLKTVADSFALVTTFNIEIGITGAILTKLDGDYRGGAALRVKEMQQEDAEELQKKIKGAKFDFNDFLKQTRTVAHMGSMSHVIEMIPGMGKVTPAQVREAEKSLKIMEAMIEAVTTVVDFFFLWMFVVLDWRQGRCFALGSMEQ